MKVSNKEMHVLTFSSPSFYHIYYSFPYVLMSGSGNLGKVFVGFLFYHLVGSHGTVVCAPWGVIIMGTTSSLQGDDRGQRDL